MNPYEYVCDLSVQKVTAAQESIEQALLSLNSEKEIFLITVRELCERANVARSTFYAYYETTDDCLLAIENRCIRDLIMLNDEFLKSESINEIDLSFFEKTVSYIKDNRELFYLFLVKRYNYRFVNRWKDGIKYHFFNRIPQNITDKNKELTLEIIACQTIGACQHWLKNPYEVDVDYLKLLIRRTIEAYTEQ